MPTQLRISIAIVAVVATVWVGGCSWMVVRTTPEDYSPQTAERPPDCTPSLGPAIGDTWDTIAVGGGLVGTGILSMTALSLKPVYGVVQIATGVVAGGVFGTSAYHGYTQARRCRRLRDDFQFHLRRRLDAWARPGAEIDLGLARSILGSGGSSGDRFGSVEATPSGTPPSSEEPQRGQNEHPEDE